MSEKTQVSGLYNAKINSANIRYLTYPVAAGVAMVSDGAAAAWAWAAYVQIVAAAVIPAVCWLRGFLAHTGVVEKAYGDLALAFGGVGAETDLPIVPFVAGIPSEVGINVALPTWLPDPIKIVGSPRLAGRIRKNTGASAMGFTLKVIVETGLAPS